MPRIPDELLKSVVFLYETEEAAKDGSRYGGTGFFVEIPYSASRQERPTPSALKVRYLVTNSHVAYPCSWVRVNTADGGCEVIQIPEWEHHQDVDDVAAAEVDIDHPGWDVWAISLFDRALNPATMRDINIGLGDDVFMLGRLTSQGRVRNDPLARFGNIAMMPGEKVIDGRDLAVVVYLVEMRSLAGFSGSPVFVHVGPGSLRRDGLVTGFNTHVDSLIGIDTGHRFNWTPVRDGPRGAKVEGLGVTENTGILLVAPVEKIIELLMQEDLLAKRRLRVDEWVQEQGGDMAQADMEVDDSAYTESQFLGDLAKVTEPERRDPAG